MAYHKATIPIKVQYIRTITETFDRSCTSATSGNHTRTSTNTLVLKHQHPSLQHICSLAYLCTYEYIIVHKQVWITHVHVGTRGCTGGHARTRMSNQAANLPQLNSEARERHSRFCDYTIALERAWNCVYTSCSRNKSLAFGLYRFDF